MRGDTVELMVEGVNGTSRTFRLTASRVGHRIEITTDDGKVVISEVKRSGRAIRTVRVPEDRVLAVVEYRGEGRDLPRAEVTGDDEAAADVETAAYAEATADDAAEQRAVDGPCAGRAAAVTRDPQADPLPGDSTQESGRGAASRAKKRPRPKRKR